ncbi:MAG: hypothetical protein JW788_00770, partial [Candidatus Omnitrophica bacterium]|nr:hypothetical protein [Candidatus Omnitrophota bacterium]
EFSRFKQVPASIKIRAEVRNNSLFYNNQQIINGVPISFKTDKYYVKAIPIIEQSKNEKWMKVKIKFFSLPSEVSSAINEGDVQKEKDSRTIAKLNKIISRSPSKVQALKLEESKIVFITDPSCDDIVASLDLLCNYDAGGNLFYKETPVKIGSQITFFSTYYWISGTIIEIEET